MTAREHDADTLVANTLAGATSSPPTRGRAAPTKIGRFTVLRELGAGGMGVVYAAYDEQLDRKVAVKLLRGEPGHDTTEGHARLLREAQALARLSHPNVVAVYEVGSFEDQVFLAMEFVQGQSLRAWLAAAPRPWRDVVRVFLQAGRGLAAAHGAGLVHRDFKPENAIVGDDGRVRVLDFGLARAPALAGEARPTFEPDAPVRSSTLASQLTIAGAVVGTPAYLAPELWAREPADARSDQFALCVSLWEALYGERPFRGETLQALADAICHGEPTAPPAGRRAPAWLHALALRGLEPDPARRFPTIDALLAALERDPERRRVRLLGGAVIVCVIALLGLGARNLSAARAERCTGGAAEIAETWGQVHKDRTRAALTASGLAYAQGTADRVIADLDDYAAAWSAAHLDACEDTAVRGEQSQELLDLRMACLAGRRAAFAEVVALLDEADATTLEHAVQAVEGLPAPGACESPSYVRAEQRLPGSPDEAIRTATIRAQLERVRALSNADRDHEADALLTTLEREEPPAALRPELALQRAIVDREREHFAAARAGYERAYMLARAAGEDRVAREAALRLLTLLDEDLQSRDLWRLWSRLAEVEVDRTGDVLDRTALLYARGVLAINASEYEQALETLTLAHERCDREPRCRAAALSNNILIKLGLTHERRGEAARALELYREAHARYVAKYGPGHPQTAETLDDIGGAQQMLGEPEAALATAKQALELRLSAYGPDSSLVAVSYNNLAGLMMDLDDLEKAAGYYRETARIEEKVFGPESTQLALTLSNLGSALYQLARYDEAREVLERGLAIQRARLGPDHVERMYSLASLGNVEHHGGRTADAELHLREARRIAELRLGGGHIHTAIIRESFAELLVTLGRAREAVALLLRARAELADAVDASHPHFAMLDTALGLAELAAGDTVAAEVALRRSLALREPPGAGEDPDALDTLAALAAAIVEREPVEALAFAARAEALARAEPPPTEQQALLQFAIAVGLTRTAGDRARAAAAACAAEVALAKLGRDADRRKRLRALGLLARCP